LRVHPLHHVEELPAEAEDDDDDDDGDDGADDSGYILTRYWHTTHISPFDG
jgi:hypothetical protein